VTRDDHCCDEAFRVDALNDEIILAGHQALKEVEHPVWLSIWTG